MIKAGSFFGVLLLVALCCPIAAQAQDEPRPSQWGPRYEDLPGQPAHGSAFQHMPDYQEGTVNTALPGQPGHGLALQHLTDAQRSMQGAPPPDSPSKVVETVSPSPLPPMPPQPDVRQSVQVFPMAATLAAPVQSPSSFSSAPPVVSRSITSAPIESSNAVVPPPPPEQLGVFTEPPPEGALTMSAPKPAFDRNAVIAPPDNTNPRVQYKPTQPVAQDLTQLGTRAGIDIGAQYYYDRYMEPDDPSVVEGGTMPAVTAAVTFTYDRYFTTLDARYAFGSVDYQGSGKLDDTTNTSWEGRWVVGYDFISDTRDNRFPPFSFSPYFGLGYRYLYNDLRGVTSTGAHGYRRENQTYYIPIGVKPRFPIDEDSRISSTFEIDPTIFGQQISYFSDLHLGDPDVKNWQPFGIGVRADISYEMSWFSIGPFINAWIMDKSREQVFHSPGSLCGGTTCVGYEPQNYTIEAGIQAKIHFMDSWLKLD